MNIIRKPSANLQMRTKKTSAVVASVNKVKSIPMKKPIPSILSIPIANPKSFDPRIKNFVPFIEHGITNSLAESTEGNYVKYIRNFIGFGKGIGFNEEELCPAKEDLILAWLSQHVGVNGESHARASLNAIAKWHMYNRVAFEKTEAMNLMVQGIKNLKPAKSTKAKRPPISPKMMRVLRDGVDLSTDEGRCIWANALALWWGNMRCGEIFPSTKAKAKGAKLPKKENIKKVSLDCYSLFLPYTKTTGSAGDTAYIFRQNDPFDPIEGILSFVNNSPGMMGSDLLCSFVNKEGKRDIMSKSMFMLRCNRIWRNAAMATSTGHSFRIGGATMFLVAGMESDKVKKHGRWKSDAALLYWRHMNVVLGEQAIRIDFQKCEALFEIANGRHDGVAGLVGRVQESLRVEDEVLDKEPSLADDVELIGERTSTSAGGVPSVGASTAPMEIVPTTGSGIKLRLPSRRRFKSRASGEK